MENSNLAAIIGVIALGLVLVILLFLRNQKDKKDLNPSGPDAVKEERTDTENDRERA